MSLRNKNSPKIILVTGGDINNIDKGIIPASIGVLLKANGYNITVIKMDPCFNQLSINLDPTRYGENYCLVDGETVSINFGYYERMLDQIFTKQNYITRGKITKYVNGQNEMKYFGDKIHSINVVEATVNWIKNIFLQPIDGKNTLPDICIIELGGALNDEISDIKFFQALSKFKHKNNFMHIHVSKLVGGELGFLEKSIQHFRNQNFSPHLIVCRSDNPFSDVYKKHIAHHSSKNIEMVTINLLVSKNNVQFLAESCTNVVKIALVAKYLINQFKEHEIFKDPYESVIEQLNVAAEKCCDCKVEISFIRAQDLEDDATKEKQNSAWTLLKEAQGIIIPGGYGDEGFKGLLKACKYARKNKKPFLSICCGFQCAVAEFAQNVCGIHSGESYKKALGKILIEMLENGNPRMGQRTVTFLTKNSKLFELYGKKNFIKERSWNRMEINPIFIPSLISRGLRFVGIGFDENESGEISKALQNLMSYAKIHDKNDKEGYIKTMEKLCKHSRKTHTALRMQILELQDHPYYIGIQYHAKFGLRPSSLSPPFVGLIKAALCKMELKEDITDSSESDTKKSYEMTIKNLHKKKDKRFFIFFINFKELVKDGIFRIDNFKDYLKSKLYNFGGTEVEAEKYKITVTSDGKFSKNYLKVLTKKYLKKKNLRHYSDTVFVEKYELCDCQKN